MKMIYLLVKRQFSEVFKFNKIFHGSEKEKRRYFLIFSIILLGIAIFAVYWFRNMSQISLIFQSSQDILNYLIKPLSLLSMIVIFFSALIRGSGILYTDKNINVYFAYPIQTRDIALAKLCFTYLLGLIIAVILLIIPILKYEFSTQHPLFIFFDLFQLLLLPAISILLGVILGYVFHRQIGRVFQSGSCIRSLLYLGLLFCFIGFMFFFFQDINFNDLYQKWFVRTGFLNVLTKSTFFTHSTEAIIFTIILFVIVVLLAYYITKTYKKWCLKTQVIDTRKKVIRRRHQRKTKLCSLLLRELYRYFSIPVYVMNSMLGIIALLLFTIYSCIETENSLMYLELLGSIFEVKNTSVICAFVISLLITLTNVTYASISIEGHNHEILKALPVSAKEIVLVKYLFHLFLTVPVIGITTIILGVAFEMSVSEWVLFFVLPTVFTAFTGMLGLFMNLLFPNYEWENVTLIVKQSIPAIFTVLSSLFINGITFWAVMYFFNNSIIVASYVLIGIFLFLTVNIGISLKWVVKNL